MDECPQCGFLQPKDKYCANCGVDIDRYKQKQKIPKHIKILKDPVVQTSGLLVGILAVILFIYLQSRSGVEVTEEALDNTNIESSTEETKKQTQKKKDIRIKGEKTKAEPKTLSVDKKTASTQPKPIKKAVSPKTQAASLPSEKSLKENQNLAFSKLKNQNQEEAPADPTRFQLRFAEVTSNSIQTVFQSGDDNNESGFLSSSNLPKTKKLNELFPNISFLPGRKNSRLPLPQALRAVFPGEDSELGLRVNLSPVSSQLQPLKLSLSVNLNLVGSDSSSLANGADGISNIQVYKDKYTLIEINLPRQKLLESFATKTSSGPLSIYGSQEFLEKQTSLLLILESL